MPVLVTDADAPLGRQVVARLRETGGEVRARSGGGEAAAVLRRAGAHVAVGARDDVGLLEAAMADVHTVIHPGGGLLSPSVDAIEARGRAVLEAAGGAGVRRVIGLSLPGATLDAGDPLRRVKAGVERRMREAALPTVVVRVSLVDTPGLRDVLAGLPPDPAVLERTVAPVRPDDLVELLVALDAARSRASAGHVVFAADGPEAMALGDYLEVVGIAREPRRLGRHYRRPGASPLLEEGLEGPWVNRDERLLDGWEFADLTPRGPAGEQEAG